MIATGRLLDPDVVNCSSGELEARFLGLLSEIRNHYKNFGIFLENPSKGAVAQFHSLPLDAQSEVLSQLRMVYQIAAEAVEAAQSSLEREPSGFGLSGELKCLKSFLWRGGFRVADDDFYTRIRDGHLIEVYNLDHRQIYRSFSFFSYCSYSLGDILVYDWNTLYSRPAWVISRIFVDICDLLEGRHRLIKMEIPEFLLTENFSSAQYANLVNMRFATALLDQRTGEICGYACTQRGTLVNNPNVREKIAFI